MATRIQRQKNQLPQPYYEGYLEKRSFKDKTSRKLWTCLCGNTLFFFNEKRDPDYIEKLDLHRLISVTDDNSQDRNLDAARLNLQMKDGNIKLTVPNAEARELWKGYILSIAELAVPPSLNLLPGQIHMLKEAVERETERIKVVLPDQLHAIKEEKPEKEKAHIFPPTAVLDSSPYVSVIADMPACYHVVSRPEAELLLEREAKRGNLLMRPATDGNFAITTRQDLDGSVFKHYRVTRKHTGGFIIAVDNPVHCATLRGVIDYLLEKTDGVLTPLILEDHYEQTISFIRSDVENGEKHVQQAASNLVPPKTPPKSVASRTTTPEPEAEPEPKPEPKPEPDLLEDEPLYLNDKSEPEKPPQKKAIMPPVPAPRSRASISTAPSSASSTSSSVSVETRTRSHTDTQGQIPLAALSELKLKLEKKARSQQ